MDRAVKIEPFSLMELTVKQSIVSILSKKQWWLKWQDPAIRVKWLDEIQYEFLHKSFAQTLKWERSSNTRRHVEMIAEKPYSQQKQELAEEWCRFVRYQRNFQVGRTQEDADTDLLNMNAYAVVRWFFTHAVLRESLQAIPVNLWSVHTLTPALNAAEKKTDVTVIPRAVDFVRAVLEKGVTVEAVGEVLTLVEPRPYTVKLLCKHCESIQNELTQVQEYIAQTIDLLAKRDVLNVEFAGSGDMATVSPTGVHGSWITDDLIPVDVKGKFVSEVAVLENVPETLKDWHPNTEKQVLDLIHPSLYCCVFRRTGQIHEALAPHSFSDPADHMKQIMFARTKVVSNQVRYSYTEYQWIPSDFHIGDDGRVRILSYINNLHPVRHADMYSSIGSIFSRFVPLFERALSSVEDGFPAPQFNVPHEYKYCKERPIVSEQFLPPARSFVKLNGKTVQVIVKVAEILLTPESPRYGGGSWHIEGTDAEQIAATGIYYFGSENIRDSRLSFRANIVEPVYAQSDEKGVALMYGLTDQALLVQILGSVNTIEDRCLVFPNTLQHKVEPFELADPRKPGVRKILAFFLVDPEKQIPSTAVIPPQQQDWIAEVQATAVTKLGLDEDTQREIQNLSRGAAMTLEEAKRYRLGLMEERSGASVPDPEDYESYFSLCEH